MTITINDNKKLFEIQDEFNTIFPYLKLEFISQINKLGNSPSKKFIKYVATTLGEYRTIHKKEHLTITANMTVADLEKQFSNTYGLQILLYRKSGKVWLETTVTDGWTLEEQNRQGESLSKQL